MSPATVPEHEPLQRSAKKGRQVGGGSVRSCSLLWPEQIENAQRQYGALIVCLLVGLGVVYTMPRAGGADAQAAAQNPAPAQNQEPNEITAVPNRPTFASTAETVHAGCSKSSTDSNGAGASGHEWASEMGHVQKSRALVSSQPDQAGRGRRRAGGLRSGIQIRNHFAEKGSAQNRGRCMSRRCPQPRPGSAREQQAIRCKCWSARISGSTILTSTKACNGLGERARRV